jgi:hypothetical protein
VARQQFVLRDLRFSQRYCWRFKSCWDVNGVSTGLTFKVDALCSNETSRNDTASLSGRLRSSAFWNLMWNESYAGIVFILFYLIFEIRKLLPFYVVVFLAYVWDHRQPRAVFRVECCEVFGVYPRLLLRSVLVGVNNVEQFVREFIFTFVASRGIGTSRFKWHLLSCDDMTRGHIF